jgi:hypothetical protein
MKRKLLSAIVIMLSTSAMANQSNAIDSLHEDREQVIKQYVKDLQNADYKDISQLFDSNGIVVSTSRGKMNAKEFFYSFLPGVTSANTELHQSFASGDDVNRYASRFHFKFTMKEGEVGEGEFVFVEGSSKLSAVYMFENLKF